MCEGAGAVPGGSYALRRTDDAAAPPSPSESARAEPRAACGRWEAGSSIFGQEAPANCCSGLERRGNWSEGPCTSVPPRDARDSVGEVPLKKHFVLDTNVLLHDPEALFRFKDNVVIVPIHVIEEIDHFKKELSEIGRSARTVSRHLDALRLRGSLADGVETDDGGIIQVHLGVELPEKFPITERNADAKILALALALKQQRKQVVFITKDTNLRVKADALGVSAVDYESQPKTIDEIYSGWTDLTASRETIDRFFRDQFLSGPDLGAP